MNYKTALDCANLSQGIYSNDVDQPRLADGPAVVLSRGGDKKTDTQFAILEDVANSQTTIVFRGSDSWKDWLLNFKFLFKRSNTGEAKLIYPEAYGDESESKARMHRGFVQAYLSVRERIHAHVNSSETTQYVVAGHSLGGAIAKLCAVDLQYNFKKKITVEAYTFGAPKVGNLGFAQSYDRRVPQTWRFVHGADFVADLPNKLFDYHHVQEKTPQSLVSPSASRRFFTRVMNHKMGGYIKAIEIKAGIAQGTKQQPDLPNSATTVAENMNATLGRFT